MSCLPENYPASRETVAFHEALQPEVGLMWQARDDLLAQLNPYTATWGLNYWEDGLGLASGQALDLDTRRRLIVAKLQGRAATTPEVLKTVAETLLGVPVEVIELYSEYTVMLAAEAGYRPGAGMEQIRRQLRDIMPAHLDWQLVLPTVVHIRIAAALGPRQSESRPPAYHGTLPPGKFCVTPVLGVRSSTITLPRAAEGCRTGRWAQPNDGPMAAHEGG